MIPMYRLAECQAAPRELLAAREVPRDDWQGHPPREWHAPELLQITRDPSIEESVGPDSDSDASPERRAREVTGTDAIGIEAGSPEELER